MSIVMILNICYRYRLRHYVRKYLKKQHDHATRTNQFLSNDDLNFLEQTILKSYVLGDFALVNSYLRGVPLDPEDGEEDNTRAHELQYLFRKIVEKKESKSSIQGPLFRGLKLETKDFQNRFWEGNTIVDQAFLSTTLKEGKAKGFVEQDLQRFPTHELLLYKIIEYQTAKPIYGYLKQFQDGPEHIFLPQTKFKILNIKKTGPHSLRGQERYLHLLELKEI